MSSIKEVALAAYGSRLPRDTGAKAQVVLDAVVAREQDLFAQIVEQAGAFGISRDTTHRVLSDLGMTAPVVEPDPCGDRLGDLEAQVADALRWARSRGYRG